MERSLSRGEQFLAAFNEIEAHFRDRLGREDHLAFTKMVSHFEQTKSLLPAHGRALRVMASLRNAIVHGQFHEGRPIADPVQPVVDEIVRLRDLILRPPLATDCLPARQICALTTRTTVEEVLDLVRRHDYSQFPVYDGRRFAGLLTTNCVARWMAHSLNASGLSTTVSGHETVGVVLAFAEPHDRAAHVASDATAAEVVDTLSTASPDGYRPAALIVTKHGGADESPVAVIVDFDLPQLNSALRLPLRAENGS